MLVIRRGTDADRAGVTFAEGELVYTTDLQEVWIGDGATAGGILVTGAGGGTISDVAYDATSWNANLDGASKNALRDILETIIAAEALNTAKVTNATHTGEVTGSGALTIHKSAISGKSAVTIDAADYLLIGDSSDSDNLKKGLVSDIAYPAADATKVAFISITQAVDLDQIETDTAANNAKVTNATHTGEVTGSGALTVHKTAISGKSAVTIDAADYLLIGDTSDSDNLKKGLVSDIAFPAAAATKLGYISVTQAVDLDTLESDTAANNAKVTNATHTGEVTGSGALTVDKTAISGKTGVAPVAGDQVLIGDASDTDNLKKVDAAYFLNPYVNIISPAQITGDQDNYNPTGWDDCTILRLDGDNGIRAITSFAAPTAATKPQFKRVILVGSYPVYYPGEHPDGTAVNRHASIGKDFIHYPGQMVDFFYDTTSSRWRIMGANEYVRPTVYYSVSGGSSTAGDHGELAILTINSGQVNASQSTTSLPAAWAITTQSLSNGGGTVYFSKSVVTFSAFASAHIFAEALLSITTVSDGTETFTTALQIVTDPSSTSLEPNNTIGIRYSHGINSGKWEVFSQDNAAGEDVADSGVTVAAATLYRLRIEIDKSKTEARAYINGAYVGKVETQLPNSVVCGARIIHLKSAGTTSRTCRVNSINAGAIHP